MTKALILFPLFQFLTDTAPACLWDKDTLAAEQARFPEVIDLITGNFPRHSREFHEWRITQTQKLIKQNPKQIELYDDLAVSQHKLGDHAAACETMKAKQAIQSGIYETYSNMGTFLIYTGDLKKSVEFLDKALSINPQAHFGREKFQKWLVEWVIAGRPNMNEGNHLDQLPGLRNLSYYDFVRSKIPLLFKTDTTEPLRQEAIRGVLGMMRFADFDNPILQEALGDLLSGGPAHVNATHLASLAYLHASRNATEAADKERLAKKFLAARITFHEGLDEKALGTELDTALAKGTKLAADVRAEEMEWIKQDKDASAEFNKRYLTK